MLPSQHAAISALAALVAAPLVKDKKKLALFWATAVGQDVDHYLWYVVRYRNPSLHDAYRFFRQHYGRSWKELGEDGDPRSLHGPLPLAVAVGAALAEPRLRPLVAALAFHGLLDAINEFLLLPAARRRATALRVRTPEQLTRPSEAVEQKAA